MADAVVFKMADGENAARIGSRSLEGQRGRGRLAAGRQDRCPVLPLHRTKLTTSPG